MATLYDADGNAYMALPVSDGWQPVLVTFADGRWFPSGPVFVKKAHANRFARLTAQAALRKQLCHIEGLRQDLEYSGPSSWWCGDALNDAPLYMFDESLLHEALVSPVLEMSA